MSLDMHGAFFGMFDGHEGRAVARYMYVASMLPKYNHGCGHASVVSTSAANGFQPTSLPRDFLNFILKVGGADDFQEQIRKIADEEIDRRELQREHRRQLEEEKEKAGAMMESLKLSGIQVFHHRPGMACSSWKLEGSGVFFIFHYPLLEIHARKSSS